MYSPERLDCQSHLSLPLTLYARRPLSWSVCPGLGMREAYKGDRGKVGGYKGISSAQFDAQFRRTIRCELTAQTNSLRYYLRYWGGLLVRVGVVVGGVGTGVGKGQPYTSEFDFIVGGPGNVRGWGHVVYRFPRFSRATLPAVAWPILLARFLEYPLRSYSRVTVPDNTENPERFRGLRFRAIISPPMRVRGPR